MRRIAIALSAVALFLILSPAGALAECAVCRDLHCDTPLKGQEGSLDCRETARLCNDKLPPRCTGGGGFDGGGGGGGLMCDSWEMWATGCNELY
jgi:hypothetical protein